MYNILVCDDDKEIVKAIEIGSTVPPVAMAMFAWKLTL